jgi:hypothetical protein
LTDVQEESYTLAAWFRPLSTPPGTGTANTARYAVIIKEGHHLGLSYNNAQRFEMDHWLTGNVLVTAGGLSTAYPPGQFYHVAGVVNRSAGSVAIYVNGQLAGTTSYTPNTAARNYGGNRWRFGIANPGAGNNRWHAHGVIDDARIYNRALCDDEILALYEQGSGGFQGVKIIRWVEVQ